MQKNEMVMHPSQGVCKITDIRKESFQNAEPKLYYVMTPIYGTAGTTIFLPVDNEKVRLRKVMSKQEIHDLICEIKNKPGSSWISDSKERQKHFSQVLKQGSHTEVMRMIAAIWSKQKELAGQGKKLHVCDEKIMENAENLIHQEFAYTLDIQIKDVAPFIAGEIGPEVLDEEMCVKS